METTQKALAEVLQKFGRNNFAKIPLHRTDYTELLSAETVDTINHLQYAFDDSGEIKYARRQCDQVINLEVWK